MTKENIIKKTFEIIDIEEMLDEAEKEINNPNTKFFTHEEIIEHARRIINGTE